MPRDINKLAAGFRAIGHPIRLQVLDLMASNGRVTWSPKRLSEELDEPLGVVSYHIRCMLDTDLVVLADTQPVRGAVEHFYKLTPKAKTVYREFMK